MITPTNKDKNAINPINSSRFGVDLWDDSTATWDSPIFYWDSNAMNFQNKDKNAINPINVTKS